MLVRATQVGFDGMSRRKPGAIFELRDPKMFSAKWMEKVGEDGEPESPPSPQEPLVAVPPPVKRGPGRPPKNPFQQAKE
jgi:hypothetical protein